MPLRTAVAFSAALLGGCGLSMDKSLKPMVGQNVEVAVAKLGYPDRQLTTPGDTYYLWSTQTEHSALMFHSTGGGMTGRVGGDPVAMSAYANAVAPIAATCNIQMAVDTTNTIQRYAWQGNDCGSYLRAMRR
jgi:hypothetical protein